MAAQHAPSKASRWLCVASVGASVIAVGGCAPPPPPPGPPGAPLALYDERADAPLQCDRDDDDRALASAAGSTCDVSRFGPGAIAAAEPSYSLCACEGIAAANTVTSGPGDLRADDVGMNGDWRSSSPIELAGLLVAGGDVQADNTLAVDALLAGGALSGSSDVRVRGDASASAVRFPERRVSVDGTLTVPEGAQLDGVANAGAIERAAVEVPTPCDCGHEPEREILAFADFDGEVPDPDALIGLSEPTTLYFGCADYRFDAIEAANELTLVIVGHTRMRISGDVLVSGPFAIELEPGAELELQVDGRFAPSNAVTMGNPDDPDALRVWIGGDVELSSPWELFGSVFAPDGDVIVSNTLALHGAIFGRSFELSSPVELFDGPRFTGDACVLRQDP